MYDVMLQTELSHPDLLRLHSLSTLSARMFPEPGAEWDTESHLRLCIQWFLLILSIMNSQKSPHLSVPLQKGASLTKVGGNIKWCHLDSEQPVPDFSLALTASGPYLPPPQLPDWSLFQVSWF